uniref:Bordetella uptake protein n=1 Tax=Variovorax paradoxus TaxID=34073 RepID=B9U5L7_VARPD|nr:Bordetella uptake protein [Variovorax paradoxus]
MNSFASCFRALCLWVTAVFVALPGLALAQSDWPSKPITLVVPYPPGGAGDQMGRMFARHLSETVKQPVIVDNRPGAGTIIGSQMVAKAKPDGYTFLLGGASNVINHFLYSKMPYGRNDLLPVAQLINRTNFLVVNPNSKFKSLADVLAQAKAQPRSVSCANYGLGTNGHLACAAFAKAVGVEFVDVPYRGGMAAIQDTLAGQVDMAMVVEALPFIQEKRLVGLAVSTAERNPYAPSIPALSETVLGFDVTPWQGIFAPAGTPADIVDRVAADIQKMLQGESSKQQFKAMGVIPVLRPSQKDFAHYVDNEFVRWEKMLKPLNIRMD